MLRKQRRGPALFELLDDDKTRRGDVLIPPGFRVVGAEAGDVVPESRAKPPVRPTPAESSPGPAGRVNIAKADIVKIDGDRLRVTLTPVSAAGVLCALCLAVVGAYAVGRRQGDQVGFVRGFARGAESLAGEALIDGVQTARNEPPATHLVQDLLQQPRPSDAVAGIVPMSAVRPRSAGESTSEPSWIPDHTYIVAQEFSSGREADAERARQFLADRGIETAIVRLDSGATQLITLRGYDHKDPAQKKLADEWLKKQRAAGVEYFASGGGYKLEGYYKTFKRDRW